MILSLSSCHMLKSDSVKIVVSTLTRLASFIPRSRIAKETVARVSILHGVGRRSGDDIIVVVL